MDSNFPTGAVYRCQSGNVRYGRTYGWSNTGVMKTNLVESTTCTLPAGASLNDTIQVVANGIASDGVHGLLISGNVVNTADSGAGSLRNAISTATNGAVITFDSGVVGANHSAHQRPTAGWHQPDD